MENNHLVKCKICGRFFETSVYATKNAKYCAECKPTVLKQQNKEKYIKAKMKNNIPEDKNPQKLTISQVNELARKCGMSYGQYQAKFLNIN